MFVVSSLFETCAALAWQSRPNILSCWFAQLIHCIINIAVATQLGGQQKQAM